MNTQYLIIGATSVVCFAGGAALSFFVTKEKLRTHYEEISQREIAEAKEFYRKLYKAEEYETPGDVVEKLHPQEEVPNEYAQDPRAAQAAEVLKSYGGHDLRRPVTTDALKQVGVVVAEETTISRNVFIEAEAAEQRITDPDWTAELMSRTEEAPYVLSQDEFMKNESDWVQVTLTYYEGDQVLADDQDKRVEDPDDVIGLYNLARFGHWSNDDNVVYIHNDVRETEFEVILNHGKYSQIVQGLG